MRSLRRAQPLLDQQTKCGGRHSHRLAAEIGGGLRVRPPGPGFGVRRRPIHAREIRRRCEEAERSPVRYDPWVPRIISLVAVFVTAALAGAASPVTVEIVLDASEVMNRPGVGGVPIHTTVRESLAAVLAEAVALEAEPVIGLRLAGGDPDAEEVEWCSATMLALPPAEIDPQQWLRVLDTVEPRGHRPLIASVRAALDDLGAAPGVRRIVVVTSGDDQCGETPQQVAAALAAVDQPTELRMVGLGLDGDVLDRYRSVPIRNVTTAEELLDALRWAVFDIEDESRPTGDPVLEPAASLAAPSRIEVGERIEITWSGPEGSEDFLSLALPGMPDDEYLEWARTEDGNPTVFRAPDVPGAYELRYIDGESGEALGRTSIEVTEIPVELRVPATARAGLRFEVHWTGPASPGDFIAISWPGTSAGRYLDWQSTTAGSPLTLSAPSKPGSYEIRYVTESGREILFRSSIEVQP